MAAVAAELTLFVALAMSLDEKMFDFDKEHEVLQIPSLLESGYEVVDTASMAMSQRLTACLDNDRMTDVYLIGEDGVNVPASKFVLGSLSPNLQTLLYSGEETKSHVSIENCRAKTLKALVEFSCSDMLNTTIWSDTEPVEIVEDMVALAKLAEMYALPNLKQQVSDVLCPCLDQLPSLACVAYNLVNSKTTPELHKAALNVLRKKPYQAFVKGPGGEIGGIASLSPDKLDTIFRDSEVDAEEIFLFQCLQEWKVVNQEVYCNTNQICRLVAQHLDFSAMHATDIEDIVLPSGIVDSGNLLSGLMTLAKAAEKKGITLRSARRRHAKAKSDSTSSVSETRAETRASRSRRFKKPEGTTLSGQSSFGNSTIEEVREPVPIPEVKATPEQSKKGRMAMHFGHTKNLKTRATKFLGSLRPRSIKEMFSESHSVDGMDNSPPPREKAPREKALREKETPKAETSYSELSAVTGVRSEEEAVQTSVAAE